jgi:RNA polymerase sigma factor (sigma-70 family)
MMEGVEGKGGDMPAKLIERVVTDLRTWSLPQEKQPGDDALMDAFLSRRDESAFAVLVQRHGPMVLGVCRRILGHAQDAEDAFQAVFWVLSRKAGAVRPRAWVGNWLYGVAVRTALKARGLRRRRREHQVQAMPPQPIAPPEPNGDAHAILDEEIERLPAKYRLAVVLCELEGRGRGEAAAQLGIPEGTLSSRLAYARRVLAKRLQARGVVLAAGGVTALLGEPVSAALSQTLLASTMQAASATGNTSATVMTLAKGAMAAMFLTKLKQVTALALLGAVALGIGFGSRYLRAETDEPTQAAPVEPDRQEPPAPALAQAKGNVGKPAAPMKDSILGLWRVLQIDRRVQVQGGMPMGPGGPRGPAGPMGSNPGAMPGDFGHQSIAYEGGNGRAFLEIKTDQATFTARDHWSQYRVKIGRGTFDRTAVAAEDEAAEKLLGIYVLEGNQLRIHFGPDKGPRPKDAKEASETWTLIRPQSRQQIYKRLDELQGNWYAISGEYNGEAFLPRELETVGLVITGDRWLMLAPYQPGQPDAMPRDLFGTEREFVLDSDGSHNFAILRVGSKGVRELHILYDLRGDELKICWARNQRPQEFKTTPGSERVLFQLKREKSEQPPADNPSANNPMGGRPNKGTAGEGKPGIAADPVGIQIRFFGPVAMKVRLFDAKEDKTAPTRLSFAKAGVYRLRVAGIPNRKNKEYYPTLEIPAINAPQAVAFLTNSYIPIELLENCFDAADEGAVVTRYYWLDAIEPNADSDGFVRVKTSATREQVPEKAIILAILRLGGINLDPQALESAPTAP